MTAPTLQVSEVRRMMDSLSPLDRAAILAELRCDATKDKSYELLPLGRDVAAFLRSKSKSASVLTVEAYESTLEKFARHFAHLELKDFEPPVGTARVEEWLDSEWGRRHAPATYNRHLAAVRSFIQWHIRRGNLHGDPTKAIDPAKKREQFRETFGGDQVEGIIAANEGLRDRIALRLLLHYGLRVSSLQAIQFKHFDHNRRRLALSLKRGKWRNLPIPERAFWLDLERHIIEAEAQPGHYLMTARWRNRYGAKDDPEKPMSRNGLHKWWYRCLTSAGIVVEGQTKGERMHKARHTAGQRVLDATGNLKAVQSMLMHESITTTADTYVGWDEERLYATLAKVFEEVDE